MNPVKWLVDYLRSVKSELQKVSWPSRRDTVRYSALVIGVSVIMAVFFAGLDFGFTKLFAAGVQLRAKMAAQAPANASSTPAATSTDTSKPTIDFNDVTPITTPASSTK